MEQQEKLRCLSGALLIVSAFTHIVQIFFVGTEWHTIGAVLFGVCYGIIGLLLIYFKEIKLITLMCAILPIIGGTLGLIRFIGMIFIEDVTNYFIIFHLVIDIIVVSICFYLYFLINKKE